MVAALTLCERFLQGRSPEVFREPRLAGGPAHPLACTSTWLPGWQVAAMDGGEVPQSVPRPACPCCLFSRVSARAVSALSSPLCCGPAQAGAGRDPEPWRGGGGIPAAPTGRRQCLHSRPSGPEDAGSLAVREVIEDTLRVE